MRQEEFRTVACMRPSQHRMDRGRHRVHPAHSDIRAVPRLHHLHRGQRHVVVVEERRADVRIRAEVRLPQLCRLRCIPIRGFGREHFDIGISRDDGLEAARTALSAGMAERSLRHDDRASSIDRLGERLGHDGAHEFVVGSEKRVDSNLIEWRDQRIHVDDGNSRLNQSIDRRSKRVDLDGLNGDEVPVARRDLLQRSSLLGHGEPTVEPRDIDVEQPAPELGGLFSLRAPGHLQADVRERCPKRFLRAAYGLAAGSSDGRRWKASRQACAHRRSGKPNQVAPLRTPRPVAR
jgi:hypothetical protein